MLEILHAEDRVCCSHLASTWSLFMGSAHTTPARLASLTDLPVFSGVTALGSKTNTARPGTAALRAVQDTPLSALVPPRPLAHHVPPVSPI